MLPMLLLAFFFPLLFEPLSEFIGGQCASAEMPDIFRFFLLWSRIRLWLFCGLARTYRNEICIDLIEHVKDVRKYHIGLCSCRPRCIFGMEFLPHCGINRQIVHERAHRGPVERTAQIRQLISRVCQQVVFYRLTMLFNRIRKA